MVAYCSTCQRYVNQICDRCGGTVGVEICEWYGCGGRMICPNCGGSGLTAKKRFTQDPYDFSKQKEMSPSVTGKQTDLEKRYFAEKEMKEKVLQKSGKGAVRTDRNCSLCGFKLDENWKFCPECGVSLNKK